MYWVIQRSKGHPPQKIEAFCPASGVQSFNRFGFGGRPGILKLFALLRVHDPSLIATLFAASAMSIFGITSASATPPSQQSANRIQRIAENQAKAAHASMKSVERLQDKIVRSTFREKFKALADGFDTAADNADLTEGQLEALILKYRQLVAQWEALELKGEQLVQNTHRYLLVTVHRKPKKKRSLGRVGSAPASISHKVHSVRASLRLPVAIIAAVAVAELGVFLLRPRVVGPTPVAVNSQSYFTSQQLERAQDFRSGQLVLLGLATLVEVGLLVLIVRRPPKLLRGSFRRPVLVGAAVGGGLSLLLGLAPLPIKAISRERSKDVGLVSQSFAGWIGDVAKSEGIGVVLGAAGGALLVFGVRRFGRRWWIPGTGVVILFAGAITFASPVILDPLFNRFRPLPEGKMRSEVLDLARKAKVDVGQVYEVDASRRTTAANAYVTGFGKTKRVVLFDTLLKDFPAKEVQLVVAHELSHARNRDVLHGLMYFAIVVPFGMFAVALLGRRFASRVGEVGPGVIPAVALAFALLAPVIGAISNQFSRALEQRADYFALSLTDDPQAMIDFEKRITLKNVIDPDPPGWVTFLLATHPTTVQRIGQAEAFAQTDPAAGVEK